MIEKLKYDIDTIRLMDYIQKIEAIFVPDPTPIDTAFKKKKNEFTPEELEEIQNRPFGFSIHMAIFRIRYNSGTIPCNFTYNDYIKNKEIQELVNHLELDVDKFWLLILFIIDYCKSQFKQGVTLKLTPLEEMVKLLELISLSGDEMTLNFKSGKLKLAIENPDTINFMAEAIAKHLKESDAQTLRGLNGKEKEDESVIIKDSPLIAYFANMFLRFFSTQPYLRNKRKKGANHSNKEKELVSLLVYFTELSDNESWFCPGEKYLKSFLSQYKDHKYPNNISSIYPEFYY